MLPGGHMQLWLLVVSISLLNLHSVQVFILQDSQREEHSFFLFINNNKIYYNLFKILTILLFNTWTIY